MTFSFRSARFVSCLAAAGLLLLFQAPLTAQETSTQTVPADQPADPTVTVAVDSWLVLGPEAWPVAAEGSSAAEDAGEGAGEDVDLGKLLNEPSLDLQGHWPAEGDAHGLRPGAGAARWSEGSPWSGADLQPGVPYKAWAATYVTVDFFTEAKLKVESAHPVRIELDGEEVASRAKSVKSQSETSEAEGADEAEGAGEAEAADEATEATETTVEPVTADLELKPGKHLLLVTSVRDPASDAPWTLSAELSGAEASAAPAFTTSDRRHVGLAELLDQHVVRSLDLAPDGRHLLLTFSNVAVPADHRVSWHHMVEVSSGEVVRELRSDVSGFEWSPDGTSYAWAAKSDAAGANGHDLWISPVDGGPARRIARNVADWAGHRWLPDGSGLVVQTTKSSEADERGFKRYRGLTDRWAGDRDVSQLWWLSARGGALRKLSFDGAHDSVADVGAGRVLVQRQVHGGTERPFYRTSLYELDLGTLEMRQIASEETMRGWVGEVFYLHPESADDHRLVVTGSPQLFGGAGRDPDLAADVVVNEYETEAYLFDPDPDDPDGGRAESFTRDWDPTVNSLQVAGGALWILGQDRSYQRIYRYDPDAGSFTELDSGSDVAGSLDVSRDGSVLAYTGEGPSSPEAVFVRGAGRDAAPRRIVRASDDVWSRVDLGRVETFSFVMDEGTEDATEILGRVNYPPDFDPDKTYPLIVSYYGGTVPSGRSFGGRYPRSYWAAHGFVVYTVQPSGATGFGQEFSARHVNAWGRRTADEILEGTKRFLDAHPFVDRERVGCIGASYGGFMTMYLVSHSDLFAAAVSHAGISNLASYWGQGWWGYLYSAAASADSYPWNARDLYVDQSPLYSADQIHTPLLLLHGDSDTNVPPVESHQMYTALKILGRDVELIEVAGEDHQIFQYDQRKVWMETILAYFTKYLHDRPEWWSELWGTPEQPKG